MQYCHRTDGPAQLAGTSYRHQWRRPRLYQNPRALIAAGESQRSQALLALIAGKPRRRRLSFGSRSLSVHAHETVRAEIEDYQRVVRAAGIKPQ